MRNYCVAISKPFPADPQRDEFTETLASRLIARGVHTLVMPELYHLRTTSGAVAALKNLQSPLIFCSWLHPRAAFWTLNVMGVPHARRVSKDNGGAKECPLVCVNLAERCCPDKWMAEIEKHFEGTFPGGTGKLMRLEGTPEERWYPVVDYGRCQNCGECAEFCLFGVYGKRADGTVIAENPEACKPGCPACSRVCPAQAIMFPLYTDDDAIAGSDQGQIQPFDAATLARIRDHRGKAQIPAVKPAQGLKKLVDNCACKTAAGAADALQQAASAAKGGDNDSYFDQVIDGVVQE